MGYLTSPTSPLTWIGHFKENQYCVSSFILPLCVVVAAAVVVVVVVVVGVVVVVVFIRMMILINQFLRRLN